MIPIDNMGGYSSEKIIDSEKVAELVSKLKASGKTVGLCQGCFDLLHPGQVRHLESSKKLCDFLIVSLTPDRFITFRKGLTRPLFHEKIRAYMLASLKCVDYVVISDYKKATEDLELIKPSVYFKGIDIINLQSPAINEEREMIKKVGGRIEYTNDPKLSTTDIISHIKNLEDSSSCWPS